MAIPDGIYDNRETGRRETYKNGKLYNSLLSVHVADAWLQSMRRGSTERAIKWGEYPDLPKEQP